MKRYVTAWPEETWLDYVWTMSRNPDVDRIDLLRQMTALRLERPSEWDTRAVRQAVTMLKAPFPMVYANTKGLVIEAESCWACLNHEHRLYWHHVITVGNGGSSQPRNLVPLCHRCHGLVHPHLPPPTTVENKYGWTQIGDMAQRTMDRLQSAWGGRDVAWSRRRQVHDDES